jgi:predicted aspartyl protease
MFAYDTTHDPPAPVVNVVLRGVVHRQPKVELPALLDTGSDLLAIPDYLVTTLRLYPVSKLRLEGVDGHRKIVNIYGIKVKIGNEPTREMEAILTALPFVILGRDWINEHYIYLEGPTQRLHISLDPITLPHS